VIHRIFSTDSRFKELTFKQGFNVLLAEKTSGARKHQTRNAAGKSSSLEIIHYALGSQSRKGSFFANDAFQDQTFGMAFDLASTIVTVHRPAGPNANRNKVFFSGEVPVYIEKELASGLTEEDQTLGVKDWNEILGRHLFGISTSSTYGPSFRMSFPYFCRLDSDGGMHEPFGSWRKQRDWQRDVTLAYLLGLDWNVLSKMEKLRKEEAHLEQLRRELKGSGIVGQIIGKTTGLLAKLAVSNRRVGELENQIQDFHILPEYREIEREASEIARAIADMADRNTADHRLIADLEESLSVEMEPSASDLERLYAAAGVQLPEVTLQRLESVKEFHRTVIRNRKSHLQSEIKAAHKRIIDRNSEAEKLQKRQSQLMGLLRTHGALDQFNRLQEELSRLRSERNLLQKQHEVAQKIEKGAADLEVQRATLHQSLIHDITERAERLEEAALLYANLSKEVSERSSIFEIEATNKGLHMDITGGPDKSKGIREQQIFCFDMLLAVMQAKRSNRLGFLVHDSHLFDAMDERQVANAIEAGARLSEVYGFQYIVTMNSDRIPYGDFSEGFDFDSHIIEQRLSDETETGGLFGFRFDSKSAKS
jgi:uncharacterized protein YydD (DUF2326 family)